MAVCIRAAMTEIELGKDRHLIVVPARWTTDTLLQYVQGEHPGAKIAIREWDIQLPSHLWIANHEGYIDYRNGERNGV